MGSFTYLFIGDQEFSYRSYVPDIVGLLFESSDYRATNKLSTDGDGDEAGSEYLEHKFVTTCGEARKRLVKHGVDLQLLKDIHFSFHSFNYDEYVASLRWRIWSYLEKKKGESIKALTVNRMLRRLLRKLKRLTPEEEFQKILYHHRKTGTKEHYIERLKAALAQVSPERSVVQAKLELRDFYRSELKTFLAQDPYIPGETDYTDFDPGAVDLELAYDIGIPVFASERTVPIEFEFTEIASAEESMSESDVAAFIHGCCAELSKRAIIMNRAFGHLNYLVDGTVPQTVELRHVVTEAARDKGQKFEKLIARLFEGLEFQVKQNLRRSDQEIDLVVLNRVHDPFWAGLQSPVIVVECRNRRKKVEAKDVRDFESKLQNFTGLCRLGLVISTSGFTKECYTTTLRSAREPYRIVLIGQKQLRERFETDITTTQWLENLILEQS